MGLFSKKQEPEGLIKKYGIIYLGGHPDYPKSKVGEIEFNIFNDRFELVETIGTQKWFKGFVIPYSKISDFQVVQRQVGTFEGIVGGIDSHQLNQANNINITYVDDGNEIILRVEMLSGITVMGQAKKCLELQDLLRINHISEQFKQKQPQSTSGNDDIPSQIKKLSELKEQGILTEEEFNSKKTELLSRL